MHKKIEVVQAPISEVDEVEENTEAETPAQAPDLTEDIIEIDTDEHFGRQVGAKVQKDSVQKKTETESPLSKPTPQPEVVKEKSPEKLKEPEPIREEEMKPAGKSLEQKIADDEIDLEELDDFNFKTWNQKRMETPKQIIIPKKEEILKTVKGPSKTEEKPQEEPEPA